MEEAFDAAWPSLRAVRAGDWLAKFGQGVSRRSNSANPTTPSARLDETVIDACEEAYGGAGQPTYFRAPSFLDPAVDRVLERRGYAWEGESLTLVGPLTGPAASDVERLSRPSREWLDASSAIAARSPVQAEAFAAILSRLKAPAAFVALRRHGAIVALGYGAVQADWLCIEAVATHPDWRGQGLARQAVSALTAWGAGQGATGAGLQVSADNPAAMALYRRLGFERELYRYHYRREPA